MAKPEPTDQLGITALNLGDKTFAIESPSGRQVSWRRHVLDRNRLCHALGKRGVTVGNRIVCYGHNSYEWVLTRTTTTMMDCYFVPLNWHLAAPEVAYIVDNCDANTIVVDCAFVSVLQKARTTEPHLFSKVLNYIVWGGDGRGDGIGEALHAVLADSWDEFLQRPSRQRSMIYTGGTSGRPKAVVTGDHELSDDEQKRVAQTTEIMVGPQGLNIACPNMVQIVAAPLYHSAPGGFLAVALAMSMTLVLMRQFDATRFLSLVQMHRVTNVIMPPILIKRICDLPMNLLTDHDLSSLTTVISVGAPLPMPVKEAALKLGMPLHEFYGSSELGLNTVLKPADMLRKPGSCGRIAPNCNMKIIDDHGNECPRGTQGLLYIQSPLQYYKAEQKTKDATLASDGSYKTVGDIAYIDDEDFVYICDRKIDMIISGGANIYPAEVEDCIFRHPDVADVAVFGTPDIDYGERVHAAVLLKPGRVASEQIIANIQEFCRSQIANFKVPRDFSFPVDFPRTPSGKILKRQLRESHGTKSKL